MYYSKKDTSIVKMVEQSGKDDEYVVLLLNLHVRIHMSNFLFLFVFIL